MSKFIKVNAIQCFDDGKPLNPGSSFAKIVIPTDSIKGVFADGTLCMEKEIIYFDCTKTHFKSFKLIDNHDLDKLIINL